MAEPPNIRDAESRLNELILTGRIMEGYESCYADDVVMQENTNEAYRGKDLNRERLGRFFGLVREVHSVRLLGSAVEGSRAYSEWEYDITYTDGFRYKLTQVAVREWVGDRVVHERFYWDPTNYPHEV